MRGKIGYGGLNIIVSFKNGIHLFVAICYLLDQNINIQMASMITYKAFGYYFARRGGQDSKLLLKLFMDNPLTVYINNG